MKLKRFLLPLIVLVSTFFMCLYLYQLLTDSDIVVNATSNNNVVLNHISDVYARDNSTVNNNNTTESNNASMNFDVLDTKTKVILCIGGVLFVIAGIYLGYGKWNQVGFMYSTNNANINTPTPENIEMSSAMPTFNHD